MDRLRRRRRLLDGRGLGGGGGGGGRHALERQFLCFAFLSIVALLSYATLHIATIGRDDDDDHSAGGRDRGVFVVDDPRGEQASSHRDQRRQRRRYHADDGGGGISIRPRGTNDVVVEKKASDAHHNPEVLATTTAQAALDERWLHDGRVVREFSRRVLSRNVARSNVVIVSPDFGDVARVVDAAPTSEHGDRAQNKRDVAAAADDDDNAIMDVAKRLRPADVAIEQGHATHLLPTSVVLSEGWSDDDASSPLSSSSSATATARRYDSDSVGWILLAYFSTHVSSSSSSTDIDSTRIDTIDDVLSPSRAGEWLKRSTITYVVFPVVAIASVPLSSVLGHHDDEYEYRTDYASDKTVRMTGLVAAGTLLDTDYRLQLLASSHHFDDDGGKKGDDDGGGSEFDYGPNSLFQSVRAVRRFLYERASRALGVEVDHVLRRRNNGGPIDDDDGVAVVLEVRFHALLFATQGLDLAIPSRSSYVDVGAHKSCTNPNNNGAGSRRRLKRCDPKLNARAMNDTIFFARCPARHDGLRLQFFANGSQSDYDALRMYGRLPQKKRTLDDVRRKRVDERTEFERSRGIVVDLHREWMKDADAESGEVEVWMGGGSDNGEEPNHRLSEAACVRADRNAIAPRVDCATRIVPTAKGAQRLQKDRSSGGDGNDNDGRRPYNLLVVMIDPLSREQLARSLPNTLALLELLGYVDFPRYTAVGDNSGPNQAALYSGVPLRDRADIRSDNGGGGGNNNSTTGRRTWIWDRLNDAGYVTMKAEDGCSSNSNMVRSIRPRTHHGEQLQEMFCFSYDRPNCLGGKMAAQHLVDYARQFIDAYDRGGGGGGGEGKETKEDDTKEASSSSHVARRPWAAFLSFVDSHEDTSTLISYLDGVLLKFLQDVPMKDTVVLFTSDHGLHYGPTFATKSGERERARPVLHVRMPSFRTDERRRALLRNAASKYVTAFDVHETLLDVLLTGLYGRGEKQHNQPGTTLMTQLPQSRLQCETTREIPKKFCDLLVNKGDDGGAGRQCEFAIDPPSIFSYYSDIPRENRPRWPDRCPVRRNHTSSKIANGGRKCLCSTDRRDWFDCSDGDIGGFDSFLLRSCGDHDLDHSLELDIRVTRDEEKVESRRALAAERADSLAAASTRGGGKEKKEAIEASFDARANVVFLEIDSVSLSQSERFFPLTWGLLKEHEIRTDAEGVSTCPTGWCAGAFNKTSVVGQSSIVNQLAALSGCLDYKDQNSNLIHYDKSTHCPAAGDGERHSFGTHNGTNVRRDHWIFDVAKNLGYITFFGEEFCYEDSPYVVQTQSAFALDVDLTLDRLFCRLARDWLRANGKVNSGMKTWSIEYDGEEVPETCFDGRSRGEIGLEHISQMWDAYDSEPKFAFLNALAAHDYSLDAAHASLGAENYDRTVYNFLNNMMLRKNDARPTYIILRSDHGLQGGPHPIDYATQIEHMHPWTAIIAPANHQNFSVEPFSLNQNRLATGFDMYHSIRYLMSPSLAKDNGKKNSLLFDSSIPPWSYNLFRETIPLNRNCRDAKIPKKFCPCISERDDMAPLWYVGHSEQPAKFVRPELNYDWTTMRFIANKLPGLSVHSNTESKHDVRLSGHVSPPRCNATLGSYIDEEMLQESWRLIDNITSLFPGSDVSGGLFLYPRQMILLSYLVQRQIDVSFGAEDAGDPNPPFRICETGFGSGHSAALFLSSAPNVEVVTFDKFDRPYQNATFTALRGYFGKRLTRVIGDSCSTVKSYGKTCHFLHGSSLCKTDNIDLINKSVAGVTLTSTAMNSLQDKAVYFGKTAQWAHLLKMGCIENIVCFTEKERTIDSKLYLAAGREQKISHKFCFAVNTGTCTSSKKPSITKTWRANHFCPNWMVPHPVHRLGAAVPNKT